MIEVVLHDMKKDYQKHPYLKTQGFRKDAEALFINLAHKARMEVEDFKEMLLLALED